MKPNNPTTHPITLAFALVFAFALAGCGSSSGSGVSTNTFGSALSQPGVARQAAAAARAVPKRGSVTQISDANTDNIEVEVGFANGQLTYMVERIDTSNTTSISSVDDTVLARRQEGDIENVELYKEVDEGQLWVNIVTDYAREKSADDVPTAIPDSNYLAAGIWVYVPNDAALDDAASLEGVAFGAFIDGNDPFTQSDLTSVTGTATYRGDAIGVFADGATSQNTSFMAEVALNVDFGDGNALGNISGTIDEFVDTDDNSISDATLMLSSPSDPADIGNVGGGFFTGDTTATEGGNTYAAGQWGGQFYGNGTGTANADQPGSVAGTFGVVETTSGCVAASNCDSFLGAFLASQ